MTRERNNLIAPGYRSQSPRPTSPESNEQCPLWVKKRTCAVHQAMSALCHKRTMHLQQKDRYSITSSAIVP